MCQHFLTGVLVALFCLLAPQRGLFAGSGNFEETCRGDGFEILVTAKKEGEAWKVRLEPRGLSSDSRVQTFEKDAPLTRVLFEDMTGDGIQELFLIFTTPGTLRNLG